MTDNKMIAVCGLDCSVCDIRLAPSDPELAHSIAIWFREHVDPQAEPGWFRCSWCLGDRTDHWSPDCWILLCAVDERGLRSCSECDDFPCAPLVEWSQQSKKYQQAFQRLQERCHGA